MDRRGEETTLFRTLTEEALIKWQQANGVSPAIGYFGPVSRAMYMALLAADLQEELIGMSDTTVVNTPVETTDDTTNGSPSRNYTSEGLYLRLKL